MAVNTFVFRRKKRPPPIVPKFQKCNAPVRVGRRLLGNIDFLIGVRVHFFRFGRFRLLFFLRYPGRFGLLFYREGFDTFNS